MKYLETDVLIIGAGPCGLMLANELGVRGINALVIDREGTVATAPQANATQARSMEHFRRHGFANEIRALGLPMDHPTDVAYFTTLSGWELGRFKMPASGQAEQVVRDKQHIWNAAEMPHRIAQSLVERTLLKHAEKHNSVTVKFNHELMDFVDHGTHIEAEVKSTMNGDSFSIKAQYMFAADGPQSTIRRKLGISYDGGDPSKRDFMGGKMLSIYIDMPNFHEELRLDKAWMYWIFNRRRRGIVASVDGDRVFTFATQTKPGETLETLTNDDAARMFTEALGRSDIPFTVTGFNTWTSGRALVASSYGRGRVLMGGDAVHLFTPTGGMGYNTALDDAVNVGWKFAAVLRNEAGPKLLETYELERRPAAIRNTSFAAKFADSVGLYIPSPQLEHDGPAGKLARQRAGAYLAEHGRNEFTIPGFTLGTRYDGSPVIIDDGSPIPPDQPSVYAPSAKPGGRAPHFWFPDDSSLYDHFGKEWTLLCMDIPNGAEKAFISSADKRNLSLKVLDLTGNSFAADLYSAPAALIRPDQHVAWRGEITDELEADNILSTVLGSLLIKGGPQND